MIQNLQVACKYQCGAVFLYKEKHIHERICIAGTMVCKHCQVSGNRSDILSHMYEAHTKELMELVVGYHETNFSSDFLRAIV